MKRWKIGAPYGNAFVEIVDANGQPVAQVRTARVVHTNGRLNEWTYEPWPDGEANVRLVVAAPDLLAACEAAFSRLCQRDPIGHDPSLWYGPDGKPNTTLGQLQTTIRRARGGGADADA